MSPFGKHLRELLLACLSVAELAAHTPADRNLIDNYRTLLTPPKKTHAKRNQK